MSIYIPNLSNCIIISECLSPRMPHNVWHADLTSNVHVHKDSQKWTHTNELIKVIIFPLWHEIVTSNVYLKAWNKWNKVYNLKMENT